MPRQQPPLVAKVVGHDSELSNSILAGGSPNRPADAAARILEQVPGFPRHAASGTAIESGRRFLASNGSSSYLDSDHYEFNLPESCRALAKPALLFGAGLQVAAEARNAAQRELDRRGHYLDLLYNASDRRRSWGTHLNVLLSRTAYQNVMQRKPHLAMFLATHLITSLTYAGQGLVGAANGRESCVYQLSQRADWFTTLFGPQTMYDRPLINQRDESHADADLARLHVIFVDPVLSPVANILQTGALQLICAIIEADWADPTLSLDDPLEAAPQVSRDLSLRRPLRTTVRGRSMSAAEIQRALAELAGEFIQSQPDIESIVPGAADIVALWRETADWLLRRDLDALSRRSDAWLKFLLVNRARRRHNLPWQAAQLKLIDAQFASLDRERSLFFRMADDGFVHGMPTPEEVARYRDHPPDDTRAWFRAQLLRRYGDAVMSINWDRIVFGLRYRRHWWSHAEIRMPDPRRHTRSECESLLEQCSCLEDVIEAACDLG